MSRKFLINTVTGWDEPPRARHQVTYALAEKHHVVFIARNKFRLFRRLDIINVHERLTIINPAYPVESRLRIRIPLINEIYQHWLFRRLQEDYGDYFVINFDFTAHRIFNYFSLSVYYCNDECTKNGKYANWLTDQYYKFCERKIIRRSTLCISTSKYLTRKLSKNNPNTFEIPLGANFVKKDSEFNQPRDKRKIVVGLLGNISQRQISVHLVNEVASHKHFQLVLIGPIEDSFNSKLVQRDRIIFKGVLKGSDLIEALSELDVGLALYNLKDINAGAFPNKLWQYLSVGKPSIVTPIENLRVQDFPLKSVYEYHEKDSLQDLIQRAFNEDSEMLFRERIDFAGENTWKKRIERLLEILKNQCENN